MLCFDNLLSISLSLPTLNPNLFKIISNCQITISVNSRKRSIQWSKNIRTLTRTDAKCS